MFGERNEQLNFRKNFAIELVKQFIRYGGNTIIACVYKVCKNNTYSIYAGALWPMIERIQVI